jgi:hypothetical protein
VLAATRDASPREQERWAVKRRALVMVAALALAAGACGGDDDSDVSSDAEATSDTSNDDADSGDDNDSGDNDSGDTGDNGDLSATEKVAQSMFTLMGLTEEQAECVVDNIDLDEFESAAEFDVSQYADAFEDCGVDTGDLSNVGEIGDVGDLSGSDQEVARQQMVRVFTLMGMTEEQANCVVDNIDLDDLDNAASADPSEYFDLFDDCGFDLTNPGG